MHLISLQLRVHSELQHIGVAEKRKDAICPTKSQIHVQYSQPSNLCIHINDSAYHLAYHVVTCSTFFNTVVEDVTL